MDGLRPSLDGSRVVRRLRAGSSQRNGTGSRPAPARTWTTFAPSAIGSYVRSTASSTRSLMARRPSASSKAARAGAAPPRHRSEALDRRCAGAPAASQSRGGLSPKGRGIAQGARRRRRSGPAHADTRARPRRSDLVLIPEQGRLRVEVRGELAAILRLSGAVNAKTPAGEPGLLVEQVKLVAGAGFEPAAFRL